MSTLVTLVEKLKAKQEECNLNESEFADRLKLSRATWYLIKNGDREPSREFLSAVMREFPELTVEIMNYLANGDNGNGEKEKE